ncbi:MAG: transglycosylase domain-containing protein [Pyrinomonadaceae bacterium]
MFRLIRFIFKVLLILALLISVWLAYEVITFPDIGELLEKNPETTALIDQRAAEARASKSEPRRIQTWVPLQKISPHLWRAVLAGEDANFSTHHGFDYEAIQKAWDEARREAARKPKKKAIRTIQAGFPYAQL